MKRLEKKKRAIKINKNIRDVLLLEETLATSEEIVTHDNEFVEL